MSSYEKDQGMSKKSWIWAGRLLPLAFLAVSFAVRGEDLTVAAGESVTISSDASYETVTVSGSLTIDSGANLSVTNMYVGHDGATGTVSVLNGAKLSATTAVYMGSLSSAGAADAGCGRLVLENGTFEGSVFMSTNCVSDGTVCDSSPTNEVWLGEGSLFWGSIYRFADPPLRIAFDGGTLKRNTGVPLQVTGQGHTYVDSIDGNSIVLDCNGAFFTFPWYMDNDHSVHLRGSGDFIHKNTTNPLHLCGGTSAVFDLSEFTGRFIADGSTLRLFRNYHLDSADEDSPRELVATNNGSFGLGYFKHTIGSFTGDGYLTNYNDSAATIYAMVTNSQSWWLLSPLIHIDKKKSGTLAVIGSMPESAIVREGTFALGDYATNSWMYYRFKIDEVNMSYYDKNMQISEFKLFDEDVDVTRPYIEVLSTNTITGGEGAAMALDGSVDTKWCTRNATSNFWVAVKYAKPLHVTRYEWWTANDACSKDSDGNPVSSWREPSAWRVQGSMDGLSWYDLDVQTNFTATPYRKSLAANFAITDEYVKVESPDSTCIDISILTNATFKVGERRDGYFSGMLNLGSAIYSAGSDFICGSDGADAAFMNPTFNGSNDLIKCGAGKSSMYGVNSLSGDVRVEDGTLSVTGIGCTNKFWRFTVKKLYWGTIFQLSELALYDADCKRVNSGITAHSAVTVSSASLLAAGNCAYEEGFGAQNSSSELTPQLFDDNLNTKCCEVSQHPTATNETSWIKIVFRLADDANPVVAYNMINGNDSDGNRNPIQWSLEASDDGTTWTTVSEVSDSNTPRANYAVFHSDVPYVLTNYAGAAANFFPNASGVFVASGARLEFPTAGSTLSTLTIDCTEGSGTISGFTPAASGVVNLVNVESVTALRQLDALPITFEDYGDMSAIRNWSVKVDGEASDYALTFYSGALRLKRGGMMVIVR